MVSEATRRVTAVAILCLLASGAAAAQTFDLVDQDRSVFAFVIVPQCGGDDAASEEAAGFEAFEAAVTATLTCEGAAALATASQGSTLGGQLFAAEGTASSQAMATTAGTMHSIASTVFEVDFSVAVATSYRLRGVLRAASSAEFILGGAQVRLLGSAGETIFEVTALPDPGGDPTVVPFANGGQLAPGAYTLRATADSVIDNDVPPDRFVLASYRLRFLGRPATD